MPFSSSLFLTSLLFSLPSVIAYLLLCREFTPENYSLDLLQGAGDFLLLLSCYPDFLFPRSPVFLFTDLRHPSSVLSLQSLVSILHSPMN